MIGGKIMALQIKKGQIHVYKCFGIIKNNMPDIIEKQVEYPSCYAMIKNVSGDKSKIFLHVVFYADNSKEQAIEYKQYEFAPSVADGSANFIQQGYEYLKTLTEFADAVDC